jgi:crotonobetainyl-CoA:carnitine CoA-transferase CaiB-like acyl-CoA transferase
MNAGLYLMSELIEPAQGRFVGAPLVNQSQTGFHPREQFYEAADGWIAVAARDAAMAARLLGVLGLERQVTGAAAAWGDAAAAAIAAAIRKWPKADLLAALARADVWSEECCTDGETLNLGDDELLRLGTVYCSEHRKFGAVRQIGPLVRLSGARRARPREAPLAGQHTDEVLLELGYAASEIEALRAGKVVA